MRLLEKAKFCKTFLYFPFTAEPHVLFILKRSGLEFSSVDSGAKSNTQLLWCLFYMEMHYLYNLWKMYLAFELVNFI